MTSYLIYRKGSNAANQPCEFGWVPVFCTDAKNREAAVLRAESAGVTCYANQLLEARPASRCSKADREAAWEAANALVEDMASF